MKRLKVLVVGSVFAVLAIGGAAASAQWIYEEPILVTMSAVEAQFDENNADNSAPATATPEATPEPTRRPTGGGGSFRTILLPIL